MSIQLSDFIYYILAQFALAGNGGAKTSALFMKTTNIRDHLFEFITFLVYGYGCITALIKYAWDKQWLSQIFYAVKEAEALKAFMKKKSNLFKWWNVIFIKVFTECYKLKSEFSEKGDLIDLIVIDMKSIKKYFLQQIIDQINDTKILEGYFWKKMAVTFFINKWRQDEGKAVVLWDSLQFDHDLTMKLKDENAAAKALEVLSEKEKLVLLNDMQLDDKESIKNEDSVKTEEHKTDVPSMDKQRRKKKKKSGDFGCYLCNGKHLARNCPDKRNIRYTTMGNKNRWFVQKRGKQVSNQYQPPYQQSFQQPYQQPYQPPYQISDYNQPPMKKQRLSWNDFSDNSNVKYEEKAVNWEEKTYIKGGERYMKNEFRGIRPCDFFTNVHKHCRNHWKECKFAHYCQRCGLWNRHPSGKCRPEYVQR